MRPQVVARGAAEGRGCHTPTHIAGGGRAPGPRHQAHQLRTAALLLPPASRGAGATHRPVLARYSRAGGPLATYRRAWRDVGVSRFRRTASTAGRNHAPPCARGETRGAGEAIATRGAAVAPRRPHGPMAGSPRLSRARLGLLLAVGAPHLRHDDGTHDGHHPPPQPSQALLYDTPGGGSWRLQPQHRRSSSSDGGHQVAQRRRLMRPPRRRQQRLPTMRARGQFAHSRGSQPGQPAQARPVQRPSGAELHRSPGVPVRIRRLWQAAPCAPLRPLSPRPSARDDARPGPPLRACTPLPLV